MAQQKPRTQYNLMHPLFDALADSELSAPQRHLMLVLFKFSDGNGVCFPSYSTLLHYTSFSRPTLCKHIKSLQDAGWISYEQGSSFSHKANKYKINLAKLGMLDEDRNMTFSGIETTHSRSHIPSHTVYKYKSWWVSEAAADYCKANRISELYTGLAMVK